MEPGFFEAQLLLADPKPQAAVQAAPRTIILLFDNSLSMQWEKLERSYAALEAVLRSLRPADHFNLLLFNQSVTPFKPAPVVADACNGPAGAGFCAIEQTARRDRPGQGAGGGTDAKHVARTHRWCC